MNNRQPGEPCENCGAELVTNPKTGKVFCPEKCWLKGATPKPQTSSPSPQSAETRAVLNVPASVWEAKDRLSAMQTAINAASALHQGTGNTAKALADAKLFYEQLRLAKQGLIARNPVGPVLKPKSAIGKKIAKVMQEDDPDLKTINVDEDEPFN